MQFVAMRVAEQDQRRLGVQRGGDQRRHAVHRHVQVGRFQQQPADLGEEGVVARTDQRLTRALRLGDVADGRGEQRVAIGLDRAQADLHRKLLAVVAHARQLVAGAHRAHARRGHVAAAVLGMRLAHLFGQQGFDLQSAQLALAIAEQAVGLGIGQHDLAVEVDYDHRVRRGIEQRLEQIRPGDRFGKCIHVRRTRSVKM